MFSNGAQIYQSIGILRGTIALALNLVRRVLLPLLLLLLLLPLLLFLLGAYAFVRPKSCWGKWCTLPMDHREGRHPTLFLARLKGKGHPPGVLEPRWPNATKYAA